MTFAIFTGELNPRVGGSIALHKLSDNLKAFGHETVFNEKGDVTIYPETTKGNPLEAESVVRWVLSTPGHVGKDRTSTWCPDDWVFAYTDYYARKLRCDGLLTAYDWRFENWGDDGKDRQGVCFVVRKGKKGNAHPDGATQLDGYPNNAMLRQAFNHHKVFLSYDTQTMLSLQAVLCGCESVVVPQDDLSAKEWRSSFPYFKFGVAYGWDDLPYARATVHLVKDHLKSLESVSMTQTQEFINKLEEK